MVIDTFTALAIKGNYSSDEFVYLLAIRLPKSIIITPVKDKAIRNMIKEKSVTNLYISAEDDIFTLDGRIVEELDEPNKWHPIGSHYNVVSKIIDDSNPENVLGYEIVDYNADTVQFVKADKFNETYYTKFDNEILPVLHDKERKNVVMLNINDTFTIGNYEYRLEIDTNSFIGYLDVWWSVSIVNKGIHCDDWIKPQLYSIDVENVVNAFCYKFDTVKLRFTISDNMELYNVYFSDKTRIIDCSELDRNSCNKFLTDNENWYNIPIIIFNKSDYISTYSKLDEVNNEASDNRIVMNSIPSNIDKTIAKAQLLGKKIFILIDN